MIRDTDKLVESTAKPKIISKYVKHLEQQHHHAYSTKIDTLFAILVPTSSSCASHIRSHRTIKGAAEIDGVQISAPFANLALLSHGKLEVGGLGHMALERNPLS